MQLNVCFALRFSIMVGLIACGAPYAAASFLNQSNSGTLVVNANGESEGFPSTANSNTGGFGGFAGTIDGDTGLFSEVGTITRPSAVFVREVTEKLRAQSIFVGFFLTFGFDGRIEPDDELAEFGTKDFIAGFFNPDPEMTIELQFTNPLDEPAILNLGYAMPLNPVFTFASNPIGEALVTAQVFDTGGEVGASAEVNVDYFSVLADDSNVQLPELSLSLDLTEADGEVIGDTGDTQSLFLSDDMFGAQTGLVAVISPGDTLSLRSSLALGNDQVPLFNRFELDAAHQSELPGFAAAAFVPEPTSLCLLMLASAASANRRLSELRTRLIAQVVAGE